MIVKAYQSSKFLYSFARVLITAYGIFRESRRMKVHSWFTSSYADASLSCTLARQRTDTSGLMRNQVRLPARSSHGLPEATVCR